MFAVYINNVNPQFDFHFISVLSSISGIGIYHISPGKSLPFLFQLLSGLVPSPELLRHLCLQLGLRRLFKYQVIPMVQPPFLKRVHHIHLVQRLLLMPVNILVKDGHKQFW